MIPCERISDFENGQLILTSPPRSDAISNIFSHGLLQRMSRVARNSFQYITHFSLGFLKKRTHAARKRFRYRKHISCGFLNGRARAVRKSLLYRPFFIWISEEKGMLCCKTFVPSKAVFYLRKSSFCARSSPMLLSKTFG